jgi:pyruvate dehydrogenase E1 component beta subunit
VRSIKPLDTARILGSVRKTGRMLAVDAGWRSLGFAGELVALASEAAFDDLRCAPRRVTPPDTYVATSAALASVFYPSSLTIVNAAREMMGRGPLTERDLGLPVDRPRDVPDASFRGPF